MRKMFVSHTLIETFYKTASFATAFSVFLLDHTSVLLVANKAIVLVALKEMFAGFTCVDLIMDSFGLITADWAVNPRDSVELPPFQPKLECRSKEEDLEDWRQCLRRI